MTTLAEDLVPDQLWALVEPLLPAPPRPPYGGRHRTISDRACFAAIVSLARTSTPWRLLPARELGCGSPATCWRRLAEWADAGVFDALHLGVLDRLVNRASWTGRRRAWTQRACAPSAGGPRGRKSSRSWQAWEQAAAGLRRCGLPLTAANVNDTTVFQAVMDDVPPIRTPAGRRRTRPAKVHADKGYDSRANRISLRRRGIKPRIARREVESSTRLGRHRWKVERSLSWLSCFRRLQVRWDRDAGRWFAFVLVACAVVCFNRL